MRTEGEALPGRRRTFPASELRRPSGTATNVHRRPGPGHRGDPDDAMRGRAVVVTTADLRAMMKISALEMMSKEFPGTPRSSVELVSDGSGGSNGWTLNHRPRKERGSSRVPEGREEDLLEGEVDANSFRAAIHLAAVIGQCFSLLPVSAKPNIVPSFRFFSLRTLYWALVTAGLCLNAVLTVIDTIIVRRDADSITSSSRWIFYVSATTVSVLYLRLAMQWRGLCLSFLRVEKRMSDIGYPPRLGLRLRAVTVVVLGLALIEYGLAKLGDTLAMDLSKYSSLNAFLSDYAHGNFPHLTMMADHYLAGKTTLYEFFRDWYGSYPHMLLISGYHPLIWAVTQFLNITATFMWNYNDLFVMLISLAIAQRFKLLNDKLHGAPKKEKTEAFWKDAREKYNCLSSFTREVDKLLSVQILFSFMNNLYFICIQLLHTVKHEDNSVLKNIYFLYSFGFLLLRAAFVSLFAASINDESKNVKKELFSVPSSSYCGEVDRFIIQATTDEIALTGLQFFNVTRSFLLTVAGTIATYEIVLVQFNGNQKTS